MKRVTLADVARDAGVSVSAASLAMRHLTFAAADHAAPTRSLAVTRRPAADLPCLAIDDRMGGQLAARHVVETHGRRRIAYLGGPPDASPRHDRLCGIRDVLDVTGAKLVADLDGRTNIAEGRRLAAELLESGTELRSLRTKKVPCRVPPSRTPRQLRQRQGADRRHRPVHRRLERPLRALRLDQDRRRAPRPLPPRSKTSFTRH